MNPTVLVLGSIVVIILLSPVCKPNTVLAIPGMVVSYVWAKVTDARFGSDPVRVTSTPITNPVLPPSGALPAPVGSFLAILVSVSLMAAKSLLLLNAA